VANIAKRLAGVVCVCGGIVLSAACASHVPLRTSPDANDAPRDSLSAYIQKVRRLSIAAAPRRPEALAVETQNVELRAALESLRDRPTGERHRRVAEAYRVAGILDLAYDHYVAACDLDGHDAAAYDGLARIWRDWGLPDLGLGDSWRALHYAPRSPVAHNTLGTLLDAIGQPTQARREFERAVELDPRAPYAWTNLCYQSFQAGELGAAVASCQRALALDPGFVPARNNMALVHAANGDLRRAEADFVNVGDQAGGQFNMGIVLSASRKYADAAEAFESAERLRPGWALAGERARQARRLAREKN
jgi:tetratricopeptide (TPR) repeat protein